MTAKKKFMTDYENTDWGQILPRVRKISRNFLRAWNPSKSWTTQHKDKMECNKMMDRMLKSLTDPLEQVHELHTKTKRMPPADRKHSHVYWDDDLKHMKARKKHWLRQWQWEKLKNNNDYKTARAKKVYECWKRALSATIQQKKRNATKEFMKQLDSNA